MGHFELIVDRISKRSPFQKKKLESYLSRQPAEFFKDADYFAKRYLSYLANDGIELDEAVSAYVKLCDDLLRYHVRFLQTGRYPTADAATAYDVMYSNPVAMKSYMVGLALSLMLWPTHYQIYKMFENTIQQKSAGIKTYLEIGPGHGAYLSRALDFLPWDTRVVVVDISETSLAIARSIIECFHPERVAQVTFALMDVLSFESSERFDYITMGEVLEHVNFPERLLCKLNELLTVDGRAFISTCANAPTIDHVYHFHTATEIQDLIRACGLKIEADRILPVEDLPMQEVIDRKITVNYCALLQKKDL